MTQALLMACCSQGEGQVRLDLGELSSSLSLSRLSQKGSSEQEIPKPRSPGVMLECRPRKSSCSGDREPRTGHSRNRGKTAAKLLPETRALPLQSSQHKPKPTQAQGKSPREAKKSCTCPGEQHLPRNAAVPSQLATKQIKHAT